MATYPPHLQFRDGMTRAEIDRIHEARCDIDTARINAEIARIRETEPLLTGRRGPFGGPRY